MRKTCVSGRQHDPELARHEPAARRRDREAQRAVARQRVPRLERLGVDLAQQRLRPQGLAAVRERDDHAVPGLDERAEVAFGLGQAARGDRRPLRLERVLLALRELVELDHAGQRDLAAELLAPQLADVRVLPHQVGAGERCDQLLLGIGVEPLLGRGLDQRVVERMQRALREDRERAQRLDLVPEELDADRLAAGRREDVDDPAAHGDLAALLDAVDAGVAGEHELLGELLHPRLVADCEPDRLGARLDRRQPVREAERRRADETACGVDLERAEPLAHEMRGRLEIGLSRGRRATRAARRSRPRGTSRPPRRRPGRRRRRRRGRRAGLSPGDPGRGQDEREQRLGDPRRRRTLDERAEPLALGELGGQQVENGLVHDDRRNRGFRRFES